MDVYQMVNDLRAWKLSQSEIARQVNSTQATIRRIERREVDPRYQVVQRIEKYYKEQAKKRKKS